MRIVFKREGRGALKAVGVNSKRTIMNKVKNLVSLILLLCIFSCNGEKETSADAITLDTDIEELGDLTKYVEFPNSLTLKVVEELGDKVKIEMPIKLLVRTDVCSDNSFSFNLEVEDADDFNVIDFGIFRPEQNLDTYEMEFKEYLKSGKIEDVHKKNISKDNWEKMLQKGSKIKISNTWSSAKFKSK